MWLTGWTKRRKITISSTNVDEALSDFPLYVPLASTDAVGAQASGNDVRFTASDGGTLLSHEWTGFNSSSRSGGFVRVPTIGASSDTDIFAYWGNASASSASDPSTVWDDYLVASHLDGYSDGQPESASGYEWIKSGSPTATTGLVGGGVQLTSNNYLRLSDYSALDFVEALAALSGFSVSCIMKNWSTATSTNRVVFALNNVDGGENGIGLRWRPDNGYADGFVKSNSILGRAYSLHGWSNGDSGHIAITTDIDDGVLTTRSYSNGSTLTHGTGSTSDTTLDFSATTPLCWIGWNSSYGVNAIMDELRVRKYAASSAELKFEHANLVNSGNEITLGAVETRPSAPIALLMEGCA